MQRKSSRVLPLTSQFRHVYYSVAAGTTPYHFRFSVSSDVFKDPDIFGRPVGVFNADCYGYTPQDPSDTRMKVKYSEDPNTKRRFPLATGFKDKSEAAVECDFWKLVLRKKYFLEIPWSHGTYEAFIEAALSVRRDVLAELADTSKWTHELLDFIDQHQSKLLEHRDAHKPELDLDEWEREAKRLPCRALFNWVQQVRHAQQELEDLPKLDRLHTINKALYRLQGLRLPEYNPRAEYAKDFEALFKEACHVSHAFGLCHKLIEGLEERRRLLKGSLDFLTKNRPAAMPDCEPGAELTYTSDGV